MSAVTTTPVKPAPAATALNIAVIIGTLVRDPRSKVLKTGETVISLDLRVKREGEETTVVPVSWIDDSEKVLEFEPGDTLVVQGQVRQTWYGPSSNFTDVLAEKVVKAGRPSTARKILASAMALIQEVSP